jgi:hypothetical protein
VSLSGFFTLDREEHFLGDPVEVTLVIRNGQSEDVYLFVPRGRAGGIRVTVKVGADAELADMTDEPEPGLVGEARLGPSETSTQEYLLTRWLRFRTPGRYTIECAIPIEYSMVSRRRRHGPDDTTTLTIATDLHLTILAAPDRSIRREG